mgnify:CR=1 FL=1
MNVNWGEASLDDPFFVKYQIGGGLCGLKGDWPPIQVAFY